MSVAFNPLSKGRILFAGPAFVGGAGLGGGIYRSDDGGTTWTAHDSVIDPTGYSIGIVHQVFVDPGDTSVVLAATSEALFRSTDGGITWNDLYNDDPALGRDTLGGNNFNFGGMDDETICYNAREDALYYGIPVGELSSGIWRSTDHGASWTLVGPDRDTLVDLFSMDISQDIPPLLLQSSDTNGGNFARSTDRGNTWNVTFFGKDTGSSIEAPKIVFSWNAANPGTGLHEVAIAQRWHPVDSPTVATTDGGLTWQTLNSPARVWGLDIDQRVSMLSKPGDPAYPRPLHFFTGVFDVSSDTVPNGMVQETTDGGISWHSTNFPKGIAGDTANPVVREIWVIKYDTSSGRLAVATEQGIYIGDTIPAVEPSPENDSTIHVTQLGNFLSISAIAPIVAVHLYDVTGRELFETSPMKSSFALDISQYEHGTYAVEVSVSGRPTFRKLVQW